MSVRVVARIRPLLDKELDKDNIVRAECGLDGKTLNVVRIPNPKNESEEFSFTFNGVYDMGTTQEELFTNEGKIPNFLLSSTLTILVAPTLKSLFQGLDVTIFAYGVTGTGKTHTMRGGLKLSERGVIPRLLSGIYRRGRKVVKDSGGETSVSVTLSYYEIYNDKVFDLFEPPEGRTSAGLPLRERDGKSIVVGLSERACDDLKDFERLYIEANNNRSTAGTKLNSQSSRSHAILMVKVTQTTGDEIRVSTASAIDLAGSEDNRRTDNGKERLVESASINKSLFVLSQCIDAIGRGDKRIPYRESKMTRILSLGQNNGITIMILNLAPLRSYHLDTLSSLNVSSRAKRIEVREIENEVVFKQPPRTTSSISGSTIQRQPLRPLANAHNTHISGAGAAQKGGEKPLKAFSVYSDRNKPAGSRPSNTASQPISRSNSIKRPSDSTFSSRPSKIVRGAPSIKLPGPELSAAKIEEMVERKVSEILATRSLNQPAPPAPVDTISEAVQRRLDALERKIEETSSQDDARADGFRFLLMAKQHKEHGEDSSALRMYELAQPFFPGQEKLQKKMENLRARIKTKREEAELLEAECFKPIPTPALELSAPSGSIEPSKELPTKSKAVRRVKASTNSVDEYQYSNMANDHDVRSSPSSFTKPSKSYKIKSKLIATKSSSHPNLDADAPLSPRTVSLLHIINSRDVTLIKSLSGVGAKKARDLVEFLELQSEEDGGRIDSLAQLCAVPGLGSKTVEKMYGGVDVGVGGLEI
jgi:DNA uptake protein ComE-like DNA-binding protein